MVLSTSLPGTGDSASLGLEDPTPLVLTATLHFSWRGMTKVNDFAELPEK